MSQYQAGAAVAPRPVLELIKQPLYDTASVAAAATEAVFFAQPVGAADANAITGAKTFAETNMRRAGALATPQQFDLYAVSWKAQNRRILAAVIGALVSLADFVDLIHRGTYNLEVGQKSYLRCRLAILPNDTTIEIDQIALAADAGVRNGWSLHSNVFDCSIPEELFDPSTGRAFLTGRRVPIHLPSEQQFSVTKNFPGGIHAAFVQSRIESMLWGVLKREVQ